MLRIHATETFKEFPVDAPLRKRYAISNHGRLISFTETFEDGDELKGSTADGYRILRYRHRHEGKILNKYIFLYKLVGEFFVPKPDDAVYLIHLDRTRDNDHHQNLRWVNREQYWEHYRNSPHVKAAKRKLIEHNIKSDGRKLTVTQVMLLKKRLLDPNRKTRMKILAKQFNVSEMQLHRIKTGENWGHIKV